MVLPIRLTLLEGLDIANIVFQVQMYGGGTWKYNEGGFVKRKGDWYVLRKGCCFDM